MLKTNLIFLPIQMFKRLTVYDYLSIFFIFLVFFLPCTDTDLGWHLRYGGYFWETGKLLKANLLTYFLADYSWPNPYPLYQIIVSFIYKHLGLFGLTLGYSTLMATTYLVFAEIGRGVKYLNVVFFFLITYFGRSVFSLGLRAQIFSFSFLIFTYFLITKSARRAKYLIFFPFVFLLWANIHGGFVLGLGVLALEIFYLQLAKKYKLRNCFFLTLVSSFLFSLVNPNGIIIYREVARHISYPLGGLIAEWVPPNYYQTAAVIGVAVAVGSMLATKKSLRKYSWILSVVIFASLALKARRFLPLYSLVVGLSFLDIFKKEIVALEKKAWLNKLATRGVLVGIVLYSLLRVGRTFNLNFNWKDYCAKGLTNMPCKALAYVKKGNLQGTNVFSAYEWGGLLEWQLPQYKYFTDGRMPAWKTQNNESPYSTYLKIIQAKEGYQQALEKYNTDILLIGRGTFLDIELSGTNNTFWKKIYQDDGSVIYIKND